MPTHPDARMLRLSLVFHGGRALLIDLHGVERYAIDYGATGRGSRFILTSNGGAGAYAFYFEDFAALAGGYASPELSGTLYRDGRRVLYKLGEQAFVLRSQRDPLGVAVQPLPPDAQRIEPTLRPRRMQDRVLLAMAAALDGVLAPKRRPS